MYWSEVPSNLSYYLSYFSNYQIVRSEKIPGCSDLPLCFGRA